MTSRKDTFRNPEYEITEEVIARHQAAVSPRTAELATALVRHLHDFAREVRLTDAEWFAAIEFLTATGQKCSERRQEFILLSDVLGLSSLLTRINQPNSPAATESTVFGPFHVEGAQHFAHGSDLANGACGEPCFVRGRVVGTDGTPVAGARVDVWQADAEGLYDVQREGLEISQGRGVLHSDGEGRFHFRSIVPEAYPIPTDGPVGILLAQLGRHPWRPAHMHFRVQAPGFHSLTTHVFRQGSRYLDSDAVFGVRPSLIAEWAHHPVGLAPDGSECERPYYTLEFEFVLDRD